MTRLLGIDAGEERIGLAVCDDDGRLAVPLAIIERKGRGLAWAAWAIAERARECGAQGIVVGLPLNMDGSFGPQAVKARALGRRVETATGLPAEFWDERMSSFIAEQQAAALTPGRRRGRRPLDDLAAAVILQSFLDAKLNPETAGPAQPTAPMGGDDTVGVEPDLDMEASC